MEREPLKKPSVVSPHTRLTLGIFSFLPLVCFALAGFGWLIRGASQLPESAATAPWAQMLGYFGYLGILATAVLLLYFLHLLLRNEQHTPASRAVWGVLLLVFNAFMLPIYWYLHIWQAPRADRQPQMSGSI